LPLVVEDPPSSPEVIFIETPPKFIETINIVDSPVRKEVEPGNLRENIFVEDSEVVFIETPAKIIETIILDDIADGPLPNTYLGHSLNLPLPEGFVVDEAEYSPPPPEWSPAVAYYEYGHQSSTEEYEWELNIE
jgi:hypothetical protein